MPAPLDLQSPERALPPTPVSVHLDVLFFASYRELAGAERRRVELDEPASAGDLVAHLRGLGNGLERLPDTAAVVVNHKVVRHDHPLGPADEVALLPPVAGG